MKETQDERTIKSHTRYNKVWKKQETAAEKHFERQKYITKGLPGKSEKQERKVKENIVRNFSMLMQSK